MVTIMLQILNIPPAIPFHKEKLYSDYHYECPQKKKDYHYEKKTKVWSRIHIEDVKRVSGGPY